MIVRAGQLAIRQPVIAAGAGIAVLISAGLVWFATGQGAATAAYVGGVLALGLIGWFVSRGNAAPQAEEFAAPDWSVTVAAIGIAGGGVAITDRANRMTCANEVYTEWFGASNAPPNLPLDHASRESMARAAREAWRDGEGQAEKLLGDDGKAWKATAIRAGRGEDFLVWHFEALVEEDPLGQISKRISGALGKMLTRAGIEAAIVGPDGAIRAVSAGFAHRASGDAKATLAGQEFATLLRADERERIFFAREGRRGAPQTLIHVPLADVDADADVAPGPDEAPSLMMLVEAGVGIGGGFGGEGQTGSAQLQGLLAALPLGLAMTDRDGRMLFANDAFLRACELPGGGLPRYPTDLVVKEDKAAISDAVRRYGRGSANIGDIAIRLKSSPDEPVSLGLAGMRGLGEAAVLLSLSDSTEETKLKRQVAQATKMQAVGQLAGGVAHDFNNVLTAIIGYCDLMLLRHTPGDSDYDDIQQIRANSNRAASLTRQLLAFSRQQTLRPVVIQLPDVISEVSQLLKRLLGQTVDLKVQHDRDLGPVRADPQQLEQVIVNLAVNARDAIQTNRKGHGKGELSFATRRVVARNVEQMGSDIIPPADYTVLIVEDNGGGIPQDKLGKIFEPFFTTKEQGKGTGLGLSTVYGIVKQSGGFIFADNVPGDDGRIKGARFTIYLPVHSGKIPVGEEPEKPAEEPASAWSGGANILLVEDEDMVRAVAERALTRQGYTVTTAADGELGLAEVANGGKFDLIVSDVVMPGMDGPAMARAIRKVKPDLPVIFMSGYAEEQLRKDIDIPNMYFMPKPFSVDQISKMVAGVLGANKVAAD